MSDPSHAKEPFKQFIWLCILALVTFLAPFIYAAGLAVFVSVDCLSVWRSWWRGRATAGFTIVVTASMLAIYPAAIAALLATQAVLLMMLHDGLEPIATLVRGRVELIETSVGHVLTRR